MASKKTKTKIDPAVQKIWDEFWKPLVCFRSGRISKERVMQELADFHLVMTEAAKVYCHVTGGRISKVNTMAHAVIDEATAVDNDALEEILKDEREAWEAEHLAADDTCYVALGGKTVAFEGRHARITTPEGMFVVAWSSETDQLFTDEKNPIPHIWRDTARDAIKALLEKTDA